MKKILVAILLTLSVLSFAQTPEQLKQLQNLSPQQIEALKKKKGEELSKYSKDKHDKSEVTPFGERTKKERVWNNPDSVRTTLGKEPMPDKYEKILRTEGDSLMVTKEEYIKLRMRADKDSVKVFGREIFNNKNLTFAPSMSMATPTNYVLSAGDQVLVTVWGAAEAEYNLTVSPEGNINIPSVGLVNVAGITVGQAQTKIRNKLVSAVAGLSDGTVHIKITLGDIRSIKVNIVGEALTPGTYTLPSLATLFNALYSAGGVSDIGSLRNIKLYREGKEVATLDVYDYLLRGKTEVDMPLKDGDMIVVAPYENIVQVTGKVRRPRLYEMKRGESLGDLINFAGDFAGDAYTGNVSLARRSGGRQYSIYTVGAPEFKQFTLADRDSVAVGEIVKTYSNKVSIQGAVWREGDFELSDKICTVGQLLRMAEGLRDDAFAGRAQIIRTRPDKTLQVIAINAGKILAGTDDDIPLQKDDNIVVTSINDLKEAQTISVRGEVNDPRTLPYADDMTLEDLIVLSKGLRESASLARIEIARRIKQPSSTEALAKRAELFSFTIPSDLSLTPEMEAFHLQPFDEVYIRRSPGYSVQQNVFISGEIIFSGEYTLASTITRMTDLVKMAGGLTAEAYVRGASLERQLTAFDLQREKSLSLLTKKSQAKGDTVRVSELAIGDYYPVGIDLQAALANPGSEANLVLKEGDRLVIPTYNNVVKISGAVYYPTATTFVPKYNKNDYIAAAGGYAKDARHRSFIIYMNGTVSAKARAAIEPGCEIVVPNRRQSEPLGAQGWISIGTSIVSMATMIVSLLK
ncbi:MAG: SLBB domain-containing protein [Mucinivorans sp.]